MNQQDYQVAIDLGTFKVSVLVVANNKVLGFSSIPYHTDKEDNNAIAQAVQTAVAEAERQAGIKIIKAYASLPDKKVKSFQKKNQVFSENRMRAVTENDITKAISAASSAETEEGYQILHIIPHAYYLDEGQAVKSPLGMHSSELSIESNIITGSQDSIRWVKELLRRCNINLDRIIASQLAIPEASLTLDEMEEGVAIVDVGHKATGLTMFHDGLLVAASALPVGGYNVSKDLTISLAITFENAEQLKKEHGSCNPSNQKLGDDIQVHPEGLDEAVPISKKDLADIIKARYQEICQLILHKLNEPDVKELQISRLVFVGGGSMAREFDKLAKQVSHFSVRIAKPSGLQGLSEEFGTAPNATVIGIILWATRNIPNRNVHVAIPNEPDSTSSVQQKGFWGKLMEKITGK